MIWPSLRGAKSSPLWFWVGLRMSALAVVTVVVIAFGMWARFAIWDAYTLGRLPPMERREMQQLRADPHSNETRLWELLERYYDVVDVLPGIASRDWLLLAGMVACSIPLILLGGLLCARPLSRQFTHVIKAAHQVADGDFSTRAPLMQGAPDELMDLANDFNDMTEKLQQYEREIRESSAMLAHELRTPLNAAMGRIQGMMEGVFPQDEEQLTLVQRQLEQINRLVGDMHLLSMARAGQLFLEMETFVLNDLIQERLSWTLPRLDEMGLTVTIDMPQNVRLHADRDRVGQVLCILIENVIRYAASGKAMDILVSTSDTGTSIAVMDRGPGVDVQHMDRMQDRFWRADHSRARHSGGSGLGLAIAAAICESHGGRLKMSPRPGGGLSAQVELPSEHPRRSVLT